MSSSNGETVAGTRSSTVTSAKDNPAVSYLRQHDLSYLRSVASDAIEISAAELGKVSNEIWSHPELYYQERRAHDLLVKFFEDKGFAVEPHYKLETAFRATWSFDSSATPHDSIHRRPNIAVLCEYDALPGIGHGCGHNLIAEVGAGAALGLKAALTVAGCPVGKITVLGTPAEEEGGGKIDLINAGAFRDVDVAMMSHPGWYSAPHVMFSSLKSVRVTFIGRASHAACDPHDGVNALDAAVMAYTNIACLRQQVKSNCRIHGIITKGGIAPNIIPHESEMQYYIRAPTERDLCQLVDKVKSCFEAAGIATGCKVEYEWDPKTYLGWILNRPLVNAYTAHAEQLGVQFIDDSELCQLNVGSTDMGNVSYAVPSIHPIFYFGSRQTEHSLGFTKQAGSPEAQYYALREAKLLAFTALDVLFKPELLDRIKFDFNEDVRQAQV